MARRCGKKDADRAGDSEAWGASAAEIGRRAKNANVEVSSLINLSLDELNLGDPRKALALTEETRERVEKFASARVGGGGRTT